MCYPTNLYLNRAPSGSMRPAVGFGKCTGNIKVGLPAYVDRNRRRDCAACTGSVQKPVDQSGSRHCSAWCIRSPTTIASWPLRADVDAAVIGRMARRERQEERIVERVALVDQQRAGRPRRSARQFMVQTPAWPAARGLAAARLLLPIGVFAAGGRCTWPSGTLAPSARSRAACSSRCGRYAGGCRTRSRYR